ncbi:uncharacterized protein RSE6_12212 [Rhynchosporium secalis]|uniref:Uncharacterized protein n=1 Tax=Rhynchosporium secalis TaxID=38038 RepID=A0A1E1MPU7_RHYSE|nr:uncharacterized protein RSE6_12212 [Rhynchosporium secalis]
MASSTSSKSPKSRTYDIESVKAKAELYMGSNPGLDNSAKNLVCHRQFYDLINGIIPERKDLLKINDTLDYRLHQMKSAEEYCQALNLSMLEDEKADQFDHAEWRESILEDQKRSPDRAKRATELLERFRTCLGWIIRLGLFNHYPKNPSRGWNYSKPGQYLAARLAESSMTTSDIYRKLEDVQ